MLHYKISCVKPSSDLPVYCVLVVMRFQREKINKMAPTYHLVWCRPSRLEKDPLPLHTWGTLRSHRACRVQIHLWNGSKQITTNWTFFVRFVSEHEQWNLACLKTVTDWLFSYDELCALCHIPDSKALVWFLFARWKVRKDEPLSFSCLHSTTYPIGSGEEREVAGEGWLQCTSREVSPWGRTLREATRGRSG